jgi:methionyl-tRNA formyltransferase
MKTAVLGCKGTTLDLIASLSAHGVAINQVITLPEPMAIKNRVAFFEGAAIARHCQQLSIPLHTVRSYALKNAADLSFFQSAKIDLLLVIGWERLLPSEVLASLGRFACGMHGSPFGLPRGRGRSPMNWSLITGHRRFVTYLFRYSPGMDDGDLIGFKVFDINEHDDIEALHMKNRICMSQLVAENYSQIADGTVRFVPQPNLPASFFPKRTREDGLIDWWRPTEEIHRFIRALAPPYPGALTRLGALELTVEEAAPFDTALYASGIHPGTILDVSHATQRFVVKTASGSLLVRSFKGAGIDQLIVGQRLDTTCWSEMACQFETRYGDGVPASAMEIRAERRGGLAPAEFPAGATQSVKAE